ncbi:hypothetical protein [Chthonobacter albigriseus]|uniref:hypothetical protein n=1 Tax=Chthonobacter albigriseus TaxID=1683161 RepID=UPI0015EEE77E|nr:hypothetical protein [Chthonobacter albigriseus]
MGKQFPEHQDVAPGEESTFANEGDAGVYDAPNLETPTGEQERPDPEDIDPNSLEADDAVWMDVSAQPASVTTGHDPTSGYDETPDGLSDLEEAVRQQAEDRALGDDEDFLA